MPLNVVYKPNSVAVSQNFRVFYRWTSISLPKTGRGQTKNCEGDGRLTHIDTPLQIRIMLQDSLRQTKEY